MSLSFCKVVELKLRGVSKRLLKVEKQRTHLLSLHEAHLVERPPCSKDYPPQTSRGMISCR